MFFPVWFAIATTALMPMQAAVSLYAPASRVEHVTAARVADAPKAKRTRKAAAPQPVMTLGWADEDEVTHF